MLCPGYLAGGPDFPDQGGGRLLCISWATSRHQGWLFLHSVNPDGLSYVPDALLDSGVKKTDVHTLWGKTNTQLLVDSWS